MDQGIRKANSVFREHGKILKKNVSPAMKSISTNTKELFEPPTANTRLICNNIVVKN